MPIPSRTIGAAALLIGCAACAKHTAGPTLDLTPTTAKWTGSISGQSGDPSAPRAAVVDGSVRMIADPDAPTHTRIDITIGFPKTNASIRWALVPDRCGSGGVPVLPINSFTPIDVGPSGRGQVTAIIPMELPTQGSYHIDIYNGQRATQYDVSACSDLKLSAK